MPDVTHGKKSSRKSWADHLRLPASELAERDMDRYPDTTLGELSYRFREQFAADKATPPPSPAYLLDTAKLVARLATFVKAVPLSRCSGAELVLMRDVLISDPVKPETRPYVQAAQQIIEQHVLDSARFVRVALKRDWTTTASNVWAVGLQQLVLALTARRDEKLLEAVAQIVKGSIPSERRFRVPEPLGLSGTGALLALAVEYGCKEAIPLFRKVMLHQMVATEPQGDTFCPLSRPQEFTILSWSLGDLLKAVLDEETNAKETRWSPQWSDVFDITTAWLEGSNTPLKNYFENLSTVHGDLQDVFGELYLHKGIRNVQRLHLSDYEDPWWLARELAAPEHRSMTDQEIILVAMGSGDHNEAFKERGEDLLRIRMEGARFGWELDVVEVRDASELTIHLLDHHQRGNRVRVLHYFGHGCQETVEFGHLVRPGRSKLEMRKVFNEPAHRELCELLPRVVDTVVLHSCSAMGEREGASRKVTNFGEGLYRATKQQISVVGLRSADGFSISHRRAGTGEVLFTGKAFWGGANVLRATRSPEEHSNLLG